MYIDRKSEIWKTSPWHVKASALGSKTVNGIRLWRNLSFFVGLAAVLVSMFSYFTGIAPIFKLAFLLSPLGFSACMYWFALDWHPTCHYFETNHFCKINGKSTRYSYIGEGSYYIC